MYDASYHPKYKAGEWTEEQVFENWLLNFTKNTSATDVQVDQLFIDYQGFGVRMFPHTLFPFLCAIN